MHDHDHAHRADGARESHEFQGPHGESPSHDGSFLALTRRRVLQALDGEVARPTFGSGDVNPSVEEWKRPQPRNPWRPGRSFYRGDHHVHTQYSPDGMNPVTRVVDHAAKYGLDWLVITDHAGVTHEKLAVEQVTSDIDKARKEHPDTLVFQGLEWNIPGAEHATVFLPPGEHTVDVLRAFERSFDGEVLAARTASGGGTGKIKRSTPAAGEPLAVEALE